MSTRNLYYHLFKNGLIQGRNEPLNDFTKQISRSEWNLLNNRNKRNIKGLSLNLLASRMANKITLEAAKQNYLSHWNLKGEKPYHRWGRLGQAYHIEENTYSYQESKTLKNDYRQALKMMAEGHRNFISEKAPYDGHKQTILREHHTSDGIGFNFYKNQFRYNEEFIDNHFQTIEYTQKRK